ncbi:MULTISPECIES: DEAD/DEAH box helicase [Paenarthrobacter]|uniref:DEAD/DEAH box helicase n=1 Tax=Paenarthrobacter TaxID=1742992 RepID=UPI001878D31C|nr:MULTISPECIES: DEAD/DEAH box helicase [Paenarthrobacter]QOT17063.1 DEAD/DEAH box helicase [Paenarthrobacter sp. YJN-5]UOD79562.1 DEAD/DEAH box helicase [Paenarthrobacter ureafaciens]WNZ02916.1 DEAD/DEAH box helicase [Paenarthrobacter ureafaciens]
MSSISGPPSPSDRYRAAANRTAEAKTYLGSFARTLDFELDDFQREACRSLQEGRGVLVAAPTGAGKTIVGEFAIYLALQRGLKAFYTTPIKALSNQKFTELSAKYGAPNVGLLTGDTTINGDAPVVVMTTEVLRNMLYADSETLGDLGFVVMDEVHYLADRFRGAVWEEVIIHLPSEVQVASLSATVSNAEEFGAWLDTVRGDTDVIVSEHRPVPLWQHVMVGREIVDLFAGDTTFDEIAPALPDTEVPDLGEAEETSASESRAVSGKSAKRAVEATVRHAVTGPEFEVNPDLLAMARSESRMNVNARYSHGGRSRRRQDRQREERQTAQRSPVRRASRPQVIDSLNRQGLLPAITFIFSRAGCDAAVAQCAASGLWLTTEREQQIIAQRVDEASHEIPADDLDVLGFWGWRDGLIRGFAAHHAGMLPTFKEVVEKLFSDGLVKAVFATETLALGVNMPARCVVLEKLEKFNGEAHVNITAGEYTQLTGRAGRRGIDVEGHAVVLWQPGTDPAAVAGLASRRTYPLNSSFRPTYNMSINLIAQFGRVRAREILESSFAQFQADRSVVGLARQVRGREESLAGYAKAMECHLGDFSEYSKLRRELSDAEQHAARDHQRARRSRVSDSLTRLIPGDVISVSGGRLAGYAVVLEVDPNAREPRPSVLTADNQLRRLGVHDIDAPVSAVTRIRIPKSFNAKVPKSRRDLAASMRNAVNGDSSRQRRNSRHEDFGLGSRAQDQERKIAEIRRALRAHPCHGCSDREDHARWSERWWKLRKETDGLVRQIQGRTNTIAKTFDRVCDVLSTYGYLDTHDDGRVTISADGQRLRRIYGEKDLLISQSIRQGAINDLDAAELASLASTLVYQAKREDRGLRPRMPSVSLETAVDIVIREWSRLEDTEEQNRLPLTAEPELGLMWPMYKWAKGRHLQEVLSGTDLAAGDFVRWAKQVVDLLDQLAKIPQLDSRLARICRESIDLVRRGVVAYSTVA